MSMRLPVYANPCIGKVVLSFVTKAVYKLGQRGYNVNREVVSITRQVMG